MSAYKKLEQVFTKISHLNHLHAIAGWDEAVMMPIGGGNARAAALSTLSQIKHETLTHPNNGELIQKAREESLTDPWQHANLKWMERHYQNATCLPTSLVTELTRCSIECEQAWRTLRVDNNWHDFQPLLTNLLKLVKESANIRADIFKLSPYDVLIDEYSPGFSQAIIDPVFKTLKNKLPNLIPHIMEKQAQESTLMPTGPFPIAQQRELGLELMQALGFNFEHGRLDVSHHPFCGGVPTDVRITTRYDEHDFITAAMGICHETGHARYEQGLPKQWLDQPVGSALGMAVHESQSLLIEMQACRSAEFMQFITPLIRDKFGDHEAFTPNNLHKLYTRVKPGLIRVDADEATYPLHIILRYELEKALLNDELTVADLPDAWHEGMQQYLGLSTKGDYRNGVMQDVHWPSGAFGYFPAYTLGSLIAAQLFARAKADHPDIPAAIAKGDFTALFHWLSNNIHSRACLVDVNALLKDATGETLNPEFFLQHVQQRYLND